MNTDEQIKQCKKDIELLQNELKKLEQKKEEEKIPKRILHGQVYKIHDSEYLIAYVGDGICGVTNISPDYTGCWSSAILTDSVNNADSLRSILINTRAKYLGKFDDLYRRI